MSLHHVTPLELPPTEQAGVGGWDGVLVEVSPAPAVTTIVEALRLAISQGFLLSDVPAAQVGLLHQRGNDHIHSFWKEEAVRRELID